MTSEGENSWKFAQCFGDKGEVEDITEGMLFSVSHPPLFRPAWMEETGPNSNQERHADR